MIDPKTPRDYRADWEIERYDAWEKSIKLRNKLRFNDNPNTNIQKLERQIMDLEKYMEYCDDMIKEIL